MEETNGLLHVSSDDSSSIVSIVDQITSTTEKSLHSSDDVGHCWMATAFTDPTTPVNVVTAVITGLYLFFGLFAALFGYRYVTLKPNT